MTIKIGIAGTHSTGKSTFIEDLECELQNLGYRVGRVNDLATEAQKLGFPILSEHTFSSTLWIMSRGITLELEASLNADIVLVDRPVPDALGYLLAALKMRHEKISDWERKYLFDLASYHAKTYLLLFKTKINPNLPIGQNKPRDHNSEFRILAAEKIDSVFDELQIPYEVLSTSNSDQVKEKTIIKLLNVLSSR
ncbi:AAA family ATPase [Leptolyngbya sp. FACHB-321]|uniref:AAA family ATPase n=1 Tax=Leptolyngbya sp. FACHB-321 TaxID=2692807 RepID=UPI001684F228|nr:AAA family ATPase [Leptolyngbya sp. FACHB-321]MBD2036996.1 AAA family ATPase [Leptolyngbya sp. FACHB-321]